MQDSGIDGFLFKSNMKCGTGTYRRSVKQQGEMEKLSPKNVLVINPSTEGEGDNFSIRGRAIAFCGSKSSL